MNLPEKAPAWPDKLWRAYLTGDHSELGPMVAGVKGFFRLLPSPPRCRVCNAPFRGPGKYLAAALGFGIGHSSLNPTLCVRCENIVKTHEVGLEMEVSLMFADVRGSTALAEELGPVAFHKVIDRFYRVATEALIASDALIEKLIGDEVAGIFAPGIAGPNHGQRALEAAIALLDATGHRDPEGPWVKVGAGVHTGKAYLGAVGAGHSLSVITVLGDAANTAARLASKAGPGEILLSNSSIQAGAPADIGESHDVELRGRSEPLPVRRIVFGTAGT
jgi:adenylate cyclase